MPRVKLTVAYDGSGFAGLQSQKSTDNTVIGTFVQALRRLNIETIPVASGRTDAGVHASGQVMHLDVPAHWTPEKLHRALNHQLPPAVRIRRIEKAADDFHARFDAKRRIYRYVIAQSAPNPFEANLVLFSRPLDHKRLQAAMQLFVGTHDFDFFKKTGSDVTHYVRTIYRAFVYRRGKYLVLYFEADGFVRSQIRMMVDALLKVEAGDMSLRQLKEQIDVQRRHTTGLAPPQGLYLAKVLY